MIYVNVGSPSKNSLAGVWKNQQVLRAEEENSRSLSSTQSVNENHPQNQGIPSSSGVANYYMEMNTNLNPIKLEQQHHTALDIDPSLGQFEMEMNTNLNPIKLEQQHDTTLDLNPSLDEFEVVYLNGPPWPTNSTHNILKKERISYQNASCLPLDFFKADPTSGIYKCINCIACQKIMMNITKKGQLQNVITPHFNGKWHGIRCMGAQGFKQPNKRKLNSKGTNETPTSDDEPQIKRRKNKKHKHRKKEDEYYKNLSSQAMAYAQDQNEKNLPT